MTKVTSTKPKYPCNDDFVTDFETEQGPGFFPGAAGYFHDCSASACPRRIVFFGTDFGTEHYWKDKVQGKGGERRSQSTVRNLRSLIEDVRRDTGIRDLACWCYLTNAVLALAKITDRVEENRDTYKAYKKPEYRSYLRQCAEIHRQWLRRHEPGLAVIMGARNLENYGHRVWSVVWPELFGPGGKWNGMEMKDALRSPVGTAESGLRVQLMYHPSLMHLWPDRERTKTKTKEALRQEMMRLAERAATEVPAR